MNPFQWPVLNTFQKNHAAEGNVYALPSAALIVARVVEVAGERPEEGGKSSTQFAKFDEHYEDSGKLFYNALELAQFSMS